MPGKGETRRAAEDSYAKFKYDATSDQDAVIIGRVAELAGVMAQNKRSDASKKHVWSTGDQKIGK